MSMADDIDRWLRDDLNQRRLLIKLLYQLSDDEAGEAVVESVNRWLSENEKWGRRGKATDKKEKPKAKGKARGRR